MSNAPWIKLYDSPTDPRLGVIYDGSNISANDGDVCIAYLTHHLLKDIKNPYCLDIGADECWWSIFCCEHYPDTRIDAFEPRPTSEEFLNYLSIKYPNITLHNKAVSNKSGFLYISNEGAASNSRTSSGFQVETITLDSFLQNSVKVNLIKIDTEGHELQILETLSNYQEKIDAIIFEFSVHWYADNLTDAIDKTYGMILKLMKSFTNIYSLSRRGPPTVFEIENDDILSFINYCFNDKYQCDLIITKKDLSS